MGQGDISIQPTQMKEEWSAIQTCNGKLLVLVHGVLRNFFKCPRVSEDGESAVLAPHYLVLILEQGYIMIAPHVPGFYPSPKSFWSCTHVNSCQNYRSTLYINLHILLNILSKTTSNIQESRKFIKSLKR